MTEETNKTALTDHEATVFLNRLAMHASRHMALSWPKNILSILCQEVLCLRDKVAQLERANSPSEPSPGDTP